MRAIVTGACGFIGSHIVRALLKKSCKVLVLTRAESDFWRLESVLGKCSYVYESDHDLLSKLQAFNADMMIHSGWKGVENFHKDAPFQKENLNIILRVLRLAKEAKIPFFIGLGSQAEYGPTNKKIVETSTLSPRTAYGKAKKKCYEMAQEFCHQNNIGFSWLRVFSTYGPMDNSCWLIPKAIKCFCKNEPLDLSSGEQTWDYLFVEDAARAIVGIGYEKKTGVYNLASGRPIKIKDVVVALHKLQNSSSSLRFGKINDKTLQTTHLEADISKILKSISWSPHIDIVTGLKLTLSSV